MNYGEKLQNRQCSHILHKCYMLNHKLKNTGYIDLLIYDLHVSQQK